MGLYYDIDLWRIEEFTSNGTIKKYFNILRR